MASPYHAGMESGERMHDIVIVGGGLVGASLAIALEPLGLDVALVDATPAGALPAVFDERSLSFAEATVNALTALGVLPLLATPGAPIRRIHVSREGDFGQATLDAARYGRSEFGQVVIAREFGMALQARLERLRGLTVYRPARLRGLALDGDARVVTIDVDGTATTLRARLVVGADGTQSAPLAPDQCGSACAGAAVTGRLPRPVLAGQVPASRQRAFQRAFERDQTAARRAGTKKPPCGHGG